MAGFTGFDDYLNERSVNGKEWHGDWSKSTGGTAHVAASWYDLNVAAGNPPAFSYLGTNKTFVAMDSTPVPITTGTATASSTSVTGITNDARIAVGQLWTGSAGTVTFSAGTYISAVSVAGTTTVTLSAAAGGSSTGTPTVTAAFPTIWHGGNVSTDLKRLMDVGINGVAAAYGASSAYLVDVLGYYPITGSDVTGTSQRSLTNTITLPRYTDGKGVRAFFVATTAPTAGGPNLTEFTYTNQDGTGSRLCPATVGMNAAAGSFASSVIHTSAAANKFNWIPLAAGDYGIRSVQTFTFSGGTAYTGSGVLALVLCRPLMHLPHTASGVAAERNSLFQSSQFPKIVDGTCLDVLFFAGGATTANTNLYGYIDTAWG